MSHPENELNSILLQLGVEHRADGAPSSLEDRLVRQTRQSHTRTGYRGLWLRSHAWSVSVVLLAMAAVTAGWLLFYTPSLPLHEVRVQTSAAPTQQAAVAPEAAEAGSTRRMQAPTRLAAQSPRRLRGPGSATTVTHDTTVERFIRLPTSEGLPEPMRPSFVRTRILTSSLQQYGIDVPSFAPPQTVLAEFVVGEDGLPRAVRLIH